MKRLAPLLVLALAPLLVGMSKKPAFNITFHAQASDMDPPKTMFPVPLDGRRVLFKIVPEISQENVIAFHPFPSETGEGNGVALQLDFRGKGALEIVTRTRTGEYLLAMVNGKPADYLVVDRPVLDGIITIWRGVPDEVIKAMDKKYTRIRPGAAPTMSENMEMLPTTRKEKERAYDDARQAERDAKKSKKDGAAAPGEPRLPAGAVSPQIPMEGVDPSALPGQPLIQPQLPNR